jgi:DUF3014 family protein
VDFPDLDLVKTTDEPAVPYRRRWPAGLWLVIAALIAGAAAAVYVRYGRALKNAPATETRKADARVPPAQPLGGQAAPITLPSLDQTDQVVRELVGQVTSNPRIAAWLATDGLIRSFTVGVANVAEGTTPAGRFGVLRPKSGFETTGPAGSLRVAPRSYERYNDLAGAMASIDPAGAARLYATLKPRIEEAYRDLGYQQASFDRALELAIVSLLRTPATDAAARVEPRSVGLGYAYADPALEGLTAPQKQLLRTGPDNVRTIQSSLRRIALALGIPAERLPPG